jgi:hypothetical protein
MKERESALEWRLTEAVDDRIFFAEIIRASSSYGLDPASSHV